jgi:hypothetical protein
MDTNKNQGTGNNTNPEKSEGQMVSCMFTDRERAEQAYNELREKGYDDKDINLVMSDDTRKEHFEGNNRKTDFGTKVTNDYESRNAGRSEGSSETRQKNVADESHPEKAGRGNDATGRAENPNEGYFGTLVGAGFTEEHAKSYESGIDDGNIFLGVYPRNTEDAEYFRKKWNTDKGKKTPNLEG